MRGLLLTFIFIFSGKLAQAEDLILCKAEVLSSMCGSGQIQIYLDVKNSSFELSTGDVYCWNTDLKAKGILVEAETPFGFTPDVKKVKLLSKVDGFEIGGVLYRIRPPNLTSLAELTLIPNITFQHQGVKFGRYNLICN